MDNLLQSIRALQQRLSDAGIPSIVIGGGGTWTTTVVTPLFTDFRYGARCQGSWPRFHVFHALR